MLPRYLPQVRPRDWGAWAVASRAATAGARARLLAMLGGAGLPPHAYPFATARGGLRAFFADLRSRAGAGTVLVSAQVCVAVRDAIRAAGLRPRFVDVDDPCPTPAPAQFAAAIDDETLAVLVAPFYGHVQSDWAALLAALGSRALVLDLAQGIGLEMQLAALRDRADAVAYSFGLGKGLDTGGGLLLTRQSLTLMLPPARDGLVFTGALMRAIALQALHAAGLYGVVLGRSDIDAGEAGAAAARMQPVTERAWVPWAARLPVFLRELDRARAHARDLGRRAGLTRHLRDAAFCFSAEATHLRQLIRLADPTRRDRLVAALRTAGVDCAPAGEPLPQENTPGHYPNAAAFRAAAIRLPFLGRLDEARFRRHADILEATVERCLS